MSEQLYFDLEFLPESPPQGKTDFRFHKSHISRAVLAWLISEKVNGLAMKTPTRKKRFMADVAAFRNKSEINPDWEGPHERLIPCETTLVECRVNREDCWPDHVNSSDLLPKLRELKKKKNDLESDIRKNEPQLRETSTLFDEYSDWHYEKSENKDYKQLRRKIAKTEKAIYKGSRFDSMRSAAVADYLYLAVPEKTVHPHELADGWGLLWVTPDNKLQLIAKAEFRNCSPLNRFHFVQNIASSSLSNVLFSHGIVLRKNTIEFVPFPRKRRKVLSVIPCGTSHEET